MQYLRPAFAFLLTCFAFLTPLGLSAATFEGQIEMSISEGRQTHHVSYQSKEGRMRISMPLPEMGEATAIVDFEAGRMLMLIPQMQAYMEIPFDVTMGQAQARTTHAGELQNTGETKQILGYTCTKYLYDDREGQVEIWATDQLGQFMSLPQGNPLQGGAPKAGWENAIEGDFFPMLLVAVNPRGQERMRLEVTGVKKLSLPDSAFAPPADYKPFNMGAMMQGMGGLRGN